MSQNARYLRSSMFKYDLSALRRQRVWMIFLGIGIWSSLLIVRLYQLQIDEGGKWIQEAKKQQSGVFRIAPERGAIIDRNGNLMAVSVPAGSVYVHPKKIKDPERAKNLIAAELELSPSDVGKAFASKSPFVWVARQVPRVKAERVEALELPGVGYVIEPKRYYPYGETASTLIGRVGTDGHGLSGLEARYEKKLAAAEVSTKVRRDAFGKVIPAGLDAFGETNLPRGSSLQLTLDADMQLILDEELQRIFEEREAKAAFGVLADPYSGEILAIGQSPSPNLNHAKLESRDLLRNLAIETSYEPGSILKPVVAAGLVEKGLVTFEDLVDCHEGKFKFQRHIINDVKPVDVVSFHDVVVRSSNIGMTQAAVKAGRYKLHGILKQFGIGQPTGLKLPGENAGILRDPKSWAEIDIATHSYGQGVASNAFQMVRAFSSLVNGGVLPHLRLTAKTGEGSEEQRVISKETAHAVKRVLFDVVNAEHGTGKNARIDGLIVGGKTGTAQKALENGRGYKKGEYMTSFIGFAEGLSVGLRRSLVLLVTVDEPQGTFRYGGTVAAPVFQRVMQRIYHTMMMRPSEAPSTLIGYQLGESLQPKTPFASLRGDRSI